MQTSFPVLDGARIDAEIASQLLLGQPTRSASANEAFGKAGPLSRGIVTEKPDDGRNISDGRQGRVAFPVGNGQGTDPDDLGNLRLEETQVRSAGADVVP